MKIANSTPNGNILIALMDYRVDHEERNIQSAYSFGFFQLNHSLISRINSYLDKGVKMQDTCDGIVINISNFQLIDTNYIFEQAESINDKNKKSDFDGIKLDSINFLESEPNLNFPIMTEGVGKLILNRKNFYVEATDLVPHGISMTIYRSAVTSYWKINHLLEREKPI